RCCPSRSCHPEARPSRALEPARRLAWLVEPQVRRVTVAARPVWGLETAQAEALPAAASGPLSAQARRVALVVLQLAPSALRPEVKREPKPYLAACRFG